MGAASGRHRGGRFVGKFVSQSPLAYFEAAEHQRSVAGEAIAAGACHIGVVASLGGPAGVTTAQNGMFGFQPTAGSLPSAIDHNQNPQRKRSHLRNLPYTIGFVSADLDDLNVMWDALLDTSNPNATMDDAEDQPPADTAAASSQRTVPNDGPLTVGVPTEWFEDHALNSGLTFKQTLEKCAKVKGDVRLEVEDIQIAKEHLETAFKASVLIASYDLAHTMTETLELNGVMEELPQRIVTAIYAGRNTTLDQYNAAKEQVDEIRRDVDSCLQDVDLIATPLLAPPFTSGNKRSLSYMIPFTLSGFPTVGLGKLGTKNDLLSSLGAVQLVGEMGGDRGLFTDAAQFMSLFS